MNIKYILDKDKAFVFDENENISLKEVTTNLDEILIQENKVEIVKNQLLENKEEIKKIK